MVYPHTHDICHKAIFFKQDDNSTDSDITQANGNTEFAVLQPHVNDHQEFSSSANRGSLTDRTPSAMEPAERLQAPLILREKGVGLRLHSPEIIPTAYSIAPKAPVTVTEMDTSGESLHVHDGNCASRTSPGNKKSHGQGISPNHAESARPCLFGYQELNSVKNSSDFLAGLQAENKLPTVDVAMVTAQAAMVPMLPMDGTWGADGSESAKPYVSPPSRHVCSFREKNMTILSSNDTQRVKDDKRRAGAHPCRCVGCFSISGPHLVLL